MLPPLLLLSFLIRNSVINPTTPNTLVTAISFLLRIQHTHYVVTQNRFLRGLPMIICYTTFLWRKRREAHLHVYHVNISDSTVGRTKNVMITQALRRNNCDASTAYSDLPNMLHKIMDIYVYSAALKCTSSIPRKCFYSS